MKLLLAFVLTLSLAAPALAQQTIFVVRHAERADTASGGTAMMATDPDLSDAGRARAQSLATMLRDAGITAVYTTQYKRTQQTAEPLAKALGLQVSVVNSKDVKGLVEKVRGGGNALVVGHSNSVGLILRALGAAEEIKLAEDEYDNLFVVVPGEKATLVRLHFR